MHSNIGVYFEDYGYAVTDMNKTLDNLNKIGITKVAATGKGNFTHYEELQDLIHSKKQDPNFNVTAIPAITVYFENADQTITLIAKNNNGYKNLCKIITESNHLGTIIENADNKSANIPIVTLENLKKHVSKGDICVTTGGVDSVFFRYLYGLDYHYNLKESQLIKDSTFHFSFQNEHFSIDSDLSYQDAADIVHLFYSRINNAEKVTKTQIQLAKSQKDYELEKILTEKYNIYQNMQSFKRENVPLIDALSKAMKQYALPHRKLVDLRANHLDNSSAIYLSELVDLYNEFENIFGSENIYFELQNHGLEEEKLGIPKFVEYIKVLNPDAKFVIGNSTRIGCLKNDSSMNTEITRLNVARFQRHKEYISPEENIQEYCIKTEDELKSDLLSLGIDSNIIESAIQNTDNLLDSCILEKEEYQSHYPKYCDDENAEFEKLCWKGLHERFPNGVSPEYEDRLKHEIRVIQNMGYAGYHLIVQDYLKYGKLLGYLSAEEVEKAPWTIEELEQLIENKQIPKIGLGIGPGRGSAAGSLCCFALGITDLDPLKYGLLFERFLNEERVSMPDIDSDFRPEIRLKAREYVKHKYGFNNVCEIVTKSYMHSKGAIKTAARYLASEYIFKTGLDNKSEKEELKKSYESAATILSKKIDELDSDLSVTELKQYYEDNRILLDSISESILNLAKDLEGVFDGYGQHAAGSIIANCDISNEIPLMWNSTSNSLETQCQNAQSEARGFLKMDFLGLINLSVITDVLQNPSDKQLIDVFQDAIKRDSVLNDPKIYSEIYSKGLTQGIFQVESDGMKDMLRNFKPKNIEDVILLIAAYRPGPLDYIPEIIASKWYDEFNGDYEKYSKFIKTVYPFSETTYKNNKEKGIAYFYDENGNVLPDKQHSISLKNNALENILKNTYGCPIYQEQIMEIFQKMAGYTLGRSDEVRRAMSKKKVDKLEHERDVFIYGNAKEIEQAKADGKPIPHEIKGCVALHGLTVEEANQLFDQMMPFARYGFNKSHAAAYAIVSCMTAWLKLYKTPDFYRASLNIEDNSKIPLYAQEFDEMNIKLLPPSLDYQGSDFKVEDGNLRFPLARVKGFTKQNYNYIPSTSLFQFIYQNPSVSKAQLRKLILAGCFQECWAMTNKNMERNRVHGNKTEMLHFMDKYYKSIIDLAALKKELSNPNLNPDDRNKKQTQHDDLWKVFREAIGVVDNQIDKSKFVPIPYNFENKLKDRAKEFDLLGYNFGLNQLRNVLQKSKLENNKTFYHLRHSYKDRCNIVAAVVLVSDCKTTKKGNPYHEVTLMDKSGVLSVHRMYPRPDREIQEFTLYKNKYFVNKIDKVEDLNKKIQHKTNNENNQNNISLEHKLQNYKEGKIDNLTDSLEKDDFDCVENEL